MSGISGVANLGEANNEKNIVCIINEKIENYHELKEILKTARCNFSNETDIISCLYGTFGTEMFKKIKGSFAIAIWDKPKKILILCRDRLGKKQLYYRKLGNDIYFNSEISPLLSLKGSLDLDITYLKDICTTWAPFGGKTIYKDIFSVNPGECLIFENGSAKINNKYYSLNFNVEGFKNKSETELVNKLDDLLNQAVKSRIGRDTPVAIYLSGGLDSSLIAAIAAKYSKEKINTFSISMDNKSTDETKYQKIMAEALNSNHYELKISDKIMSDRFCEVISRLQIPVLKASVIPMYLLAEFINQKGFKHAFSGQGADEFFGGYDLFKEVKLREFFEDNPEDNLTQYNELYPYISNFKNKSAAALKMFFNQTKSSDLFSSHAVRFKFGEYCAQFFSEKAKGKLKSYEVIKNLKNIIPTEFYNFSSISKAQFLEINTFTANYLLASEGECASSFHDIQGEYPFLDNDIFEFALCLNDELKMKGLNEKYLLKEVAKKYLPAEIINRKKTPFRAIINHKMLLVNEKINLSISENQLRNYNIFNADAITKFVNKIKLKNEISEKELMLLLFIVSTQILAVSNKIIF